MYSPEIEKQILEYWKSIGLTHRLLAKSLKSGKKWSYLDGPPFANDDIHVGHAWGRALRDSEIRYRLMRGYKIYVRPGFDTHGLPIEVKLEKEHGFTNKDDIIKYGVDKFIEEARQFAYKNINKQISSFKRLGVLADYDNPYFTYDNNYIERIWKIIKKAWEEGLLYKGKYVVHWCPRCQTALAPNYEVIYKEVEDPSIFVKFPLKNEDAYLLIWTTTPWTLPYNLGVMVNPNATYVLVELENGEKLYIAKDRLIVLVTLGHKYKILKEVQGKDLEGLEYYPPFYEEWKEIYDELKKQYKNVHTVWLSEEYVSLEEGTGLVHAAPGCGPEDFEVGLKYNVPPFNDLKEDGSFVREPFKGWVAKKDDDKFIELLEKKGLLFHKDKIKHNYPVCERCKSKLIFRVTEEWYWKVTAYKNKMIEEASKVNWVPEKAKRAMLQWLSNIRDWAISRQRFWGIPLPIWKCENNHYLVISSKEELEKYSGLTLKRFIIIVKHKELDKDYIKTHFGDFIETDDVESVIEKEKEAIILTNRDANELEQKLKEKYYVYRFGGDSYTILRVYSYDLHKPWIDNIEIKCPVCGRPMKREPDVLDVWLDSGGAFYATFDNEEAYKIFYPFDFILEGWDQIRGWFYSLLGEGVLYTNQSPYKNVYVSGFVLDEQGRKMSKSLGNFIYARELMEKYGADAVRLFTIQATGPYQDLILRIDGIKEKQSNLNILYNIVKYYFDQKEYLKVNPEPKKLNIVDQYVIYKINKAIEETINYFENYQIWKAPKPLEEFWLELSRFYIKVNRERIEKSKDDAATILYVLKYSLDKLIRAIAPIIPFSAEYLYQKMRDELGYKEESVHLLPYPEPEKIEFQYLEEIEIMKKVIEMANSLRNKHGIGIRWPLPKLYISKQLPKEIEEILKEVLNVKEIVYTKEGIDDVIVNDIEVGLSFKLDSNLIREGLIRETIRRIQEARKKLKLKKYQPIKLKIEGIDYKGFEDLIKNRVNAEFSENEEWDLVEEYNIKGHKVKIFVKK
ncbi:NEQ230 [Nanoarchaeum equitans Kin4-M]|uniref:Isoleucine--tRNA ligase n=1 Tax=Nanoarchaeum equitans (strain Kin4-M) TaxID=228908 RepID=Q74NE3_NANEQ|nr:NEQ230 [Nanoarchaeum equitans Kin4-M]